METQFIERLEGKLAYTDYGGTDPDLTDPAEEGRLVVGPTGGRLELVEGAGHYPQSEMPAQTAAFVLDPLRRAVST
jgi:hypothetical protein